MGLGRFDAGSLPAKGGAIALLSLLLLWPLGQVEGLTSERQAVREQARATIAARVGGQQWLAGPVLRVPVQRRRVVVPTPAREAAPATARELPPTYVWDDVEPLFLRSEALDVDGSMQVEQLRKGLHEVPVYRATLALRGRFAAPGAQARAVDPVEERVLWEQSRMVLPLSALESIGRLERFALDGEALEAGGDGFLKARALAAPVPLDEARRDRELPFEVKLSLSGSEALRLVPLSATTQLALSGDWPHPDFDGADATVARRIDGKGFAASWQTTRLRWSVPPAWRGEAFDSAQLLASGSGVTLFQPLDVYVLNHRAVHYGVLFIAMTFLALFAWEHASRGVRLHTMQYLLVGLALATFFLLLLALSEHVGFALAYALAATGLVLLVSYYVAGVVANRRVAAAVGGGLAVGYGLLYAILASEEHALLLGALTVTAALAALMISTRRLDWRAPRGSAPPAGPQAIGS